MPFVSAFNVVQRDIDVRRFQRSPFFQALYDFRMQQQKPITQQEPLEIVGPAKFPADHSHPDTVTVLTAYLECIQADPDISPMKVIFQHPHARSMVKTLELIADYTCDSALVSICTATKACLDFKETVSTTPLLHCKWVEDMYTLQVCTVFAEVMADPDLADIASAIRTIYDRFPIPDVTIMLH